MSAFDAMLRAPTGGAASPKKATHDKATPSNASRSAIHPAKGVSDDSLSFLHNLSTTQKSAENPARVQAVVKGNPAEEVGSPKVDEQPSQSTKALCEGAVALIDLATVRAELNKNEPTRRYIGASGIGSSCDAYLTLSLRGFPSDTPTPQLLRIFGDGNRVETLVVGALNASGHRVEEVDPSTGKQWSYSSHGGHHAANLDGYITLLGSDERMTLEIKSMNRKMFESFQKKGVKLSHPHYYDQVVDGLLLAQMSGVEVDKCFLIAYCKDNSQFHAEVVEFDQNKADEILNRVDALVAGKAIQRAGAYAGEFQCAGCDKRTSCWNPNVLERSCWHCEFADAMTDSDGKHWYCTIHKQPATETCTSFSLFKPKAKP